MKKDAAFYFLNLISDCLRCANALLRDDLHGCNASLARARKTLAYLRTADRPGAYEEGLLLLRAFSHAQARGTVPEFKKHLSVLAVSFRPPVF